MTKKTSNTDKQFKKIKTATNGCIIACVIIAIFLLFLFLINRNFSCDQPIDSAIFGAYGDIISGVIGSIVGFLSAILLARTFLNQAEVNENVIETNQSVIKANENTIAASQAQYYQTQIQVFDNKFHSFFDAYNTAIDNYVWKEETGRMAFELIAKEFISTPFENNNDYKRRSESAVEEYKNFYSNHRIFLSVHFRMLYLLVSLIATSELEEDDKVMYAKLVRGQLSDAEMFLLRYNCKSFLGSKMKTYCNQFNLIKHCPTLTLLEFRNYYNILMKDDDAIALINGLDSFFISLKKKSPLCMKIMELTQAQ